MSNANNYIRVYTNMYSGKCVIGANQNAEYPDVLTVYAEHLAVTLIWRFDDVD